MLEASRAALSERWPERLVELEDAPVPDGLERVDGGSSPTLKVNGVHLTSVVDRAAEAAEQAALVPAGAKEAWVYGVGLGDLARELLAREELERLHVVVLNRGLTRAALGLVDASDWLRDGRVRLHLGESLQRIEGPFAANPAELALAEDSCARLRDWVLQELAAPWVAERMNERAEHFQRAVNANLELLAEDRDVEELFGTRVGETIFLAGAGPTLEDAFELLHGSRAPLVAVDGALRALVHAGIRPELVVSIDHHTDGMSKLFDLGGRRLTDTGLVYWPVVPHEQLEAWSGPRYASYGEHPRWSQLDAAVPKAKLWGSGTVTHVAVDLAVKMGATRVVLFGCDFGFARGRTHVRGNPYSRPWEAPPGAGPWVHDVNGERLATLPNLCGYLRDFERYVAAHPEVEFVNASRAGARIEGTRTLEEAALEHVL